MARLLFSHPLNIPPFPSISNQTPKQVFIGSSLVPFFARYTNRWEHAQKAAATQAALAEAVGALEGGEGGEGAAKKQQEGGAAAGPADSAAEVEGSDKTPGASSDGEAGRTSGGPRLRRVPTWKKMVSAATFRLYSV